MKGKKDRNITRKKRHLRVRKKIFGTAERLRLNVFRSNRHIYAQIIDDQKGVVIASASTLSAELRSSLKRGGNVEAAKAVGAAIAGMAAEKSITNVIFDRGGYLYHGRIKALADAAREKGLIF